jgi:hypothetical protein
MQRVEEHYADLKPTFAAKELEENHDFVINKETPSPVDDRTWFMDK